MVRADPRAQPRILDLLKQAERKHFMNKSSRTRAKTWPYPRRRDFEKRLQEAATAWFQDKGFPVRAQSPYILADWKHWTQNIILPEVAQYIQKERAQREARRQGFPLHNYIHHGLSSQAMLFNLVGPLVAEQDLDPLREALTRHGITWPAGEVSASFEYEDRAIFNEDTGQPTSIDLVLKDGDGHPRLFIESKLSEKEFGGCSVFERGDCDGRNPAHDFSLCYLHHLGRRYWELLDKHGFLSGPIGQDATCILSTYYQFFREVIFALELNGSFVLLCDDRNPTFCCEGPSGERGLMPFLLSLVPPSPHARIATVTVRQVVAVVKSSGRHGWIAEFERKYGLL
jgi:POLQ-like helicase